LPLRGATPYLVALGSRLSIGITIEVTPFIDVLAARLLLFLLEEFPFNTYRSLRSEPPSHGFRVVSLTSAHLERLFCPGVSGVHFPDLFLHSREVFCSHASPHRSWTFSLFPCDRAMIKVWVLHCASPRAFCSIDLSRRGHGPLMVYESLEQALGLKPGT
jgi:hypothetical protein